MSAKLETHIRRAYNGSDRARVDKLLAEQSRWQRKSTIASNKLADVRRRLDKLAIELSEPRKDGAQ